MKQFILCIFILSLSSCSSAYYGAMEKMGYHKRDILSSRVEKARDSQEEAKEQFASALEKFRSVVSFSGGELESRYKELDREYQKSNDSAEDVKKRIQSVESVAEDLFEEWEDELDSYSNDRLKASSEQKLRATRKRYDDLISVMKKAESKIPPVLTAFHDQVLFLKHNLNASAISALQQETVRIESDVDRLLKEMERSIAEADEFIRSLEG